MRSPVYALPFEASQIQTIGASELFMSRLKS